MRKSWIVIIILAIIIAGAVAYVAMMRQQNTDTPSSTAQPQTTQESTGTAETPAPTTTQPGAYLDYNADSVAKTAGRKILFFYAPWCPQCRALEQSIKASTIPSGVTIFKTDFDSSTELRQKYGVSIQTTLVEIDSAGNKIQSYTAYNTPDLQTVIKEMKL